MIRLFDTARGEVVPVEPREPGKVSMYVCGPTVYGPPHIGHGRFALVFDVLRRYLEWSGLEVTFVSNITDVDDNIIERGQAEDRDPAEIAVKCERVHYQAMDAIGVKRPDHDPHASAFIDRMIDIVGELVDAGVAYETGDGVYFEVEAFDGYGLLARQDLESLRAGARVEVDTDKRSPVDFALWKKAKPGEPSWESPWGPGRPGWHTECVVMSLDLLGDGFDIHGGGQDLMFPHHENERAQAVALGHRFARHWVHNGFVEVDGTKMSKSLDNFVNLLDLVESVDPRAYRLLVLRSHYRSPVEVTNETNADAAAALARLDGLARRTAGLPAAPPDPDDLERFRALMDDDLDTPGVVDLVFRLIRRANTALDENEPEVAAVLAATVTEITGAVGLFAAGDPDNQIPDEVLALANGRDAARTDRDWAAADRIRDEITAAGYRVEDTPDGTRIHRG